MTTRGSDEDEYRERAKIEREKFNALVRDATNRTCRKRYAPDDDDRTEKKTRETMSDEDRLNELIKLCKDRVKILNNSIEARADAKEDAEEDDTFELEVLKQLISEYKIDLLALQFHASSLG